MELLDLFNTPKTKEDRLTIFGWKEAGRFFEATIPASVKRQGIRASKEYIRKNDIFIRPWGSTPFGSWF